MFRKLNCSRDLRGDSERRPNEKKSRLNKNDEEYVRSGQKGSVGSLKDEEP